VLCIPSVWVFMLYLFVATIWKFLKVEKFLQLRAGCMYYTSVMSSTNMDIFNETA
jgi:hypothetical protein